MPNTNSNKRKADELVGGGDEDLLAKIDRLEEQATSMQQEIEELKKEVATLKGENTTLRATSNAMEEESEEEDDDVDDEDSVCDGSTWSKKYFMLKQYKQENGHCKAPQKTPLGTFVKDQRVYYKKKTLSQERVDKLNKIGFYWGKGYPEPPTWEDRFEELKKYHSTFHHCNIHVDADPEKQTKLAKWVLEQRKQGKRLQKQIPSSMTMEQYKLLDSLNFKWKVPKSRRS